jgi:hypothetical protein
MPPRTRSRGKQLDTAKAAERAGIAPGSIQRLRHRDKVQPRTYPPGHELAGQPWLRFPKPDGHVGITPYWYEDTIDEHVKNVRGPGRPPKNTPTEEYQ